MRKTRPDQATSNFHDMVPQRFPLIPRPKPACRALEVRIARVRELAHLAAQRTDESLVRAAEAHNLTALIMSDCGMPALARDLCRRQVEVFLTARPLDAATAKLVLQPLVNRGRLFIRDGDGTAAYQLLEALFEAVKSRTDTVIDGRKIRLAHLISHDDDHREVVKWMWSVLLDGRQVAILAQCEAGDYDTAFRVLADSSTPTPWEEAIAACLRVLCLTLADRPADSDIATMMDRYLAFEPAREHVVFQARLGLCVIDLAAGDRRVPQVADVVVRDALKAADAY